MNTLQAEKLRDLIAFLEELGASEITVINLHDYDTHVAINLAFELRKRKP